MHASAPGSGNATPKNTQKKERRPYEEIGASFNGNEPKDVHPHWPPPKIATMIGPALLSSSGNFYQIVRPPRTIKIRVPKSTFKPPKLTPSQLKLEQTCTCDDDHAICEEDCGMENAYGPQNKLDVQIPDDICEGMTSRTPMNSEMVYCTKEHHDTMCNVTPKNAPKGVAAHKRLHPDKDIFILKIGKQTDEPNRTGNIEVELVTPREPAKLRPATHSCKQVQCEDEEQPAHKCMGCRCRPIACKRSKPRRCF